MELTEDFNLALAETHLGGELAATLPGCRRIFTDGNADNVIATALSSSAGHYGHSSPRGDGSDNLQCVSAPLDGSWAIEPGEHLVSAPPDSHRVRTFAGLPEGLDSARYRALGNAVTAKVSEWLAWRIRQVIEQAH